MVSSVFRGSLLPAQAWLGAPLGSQISLVLSLILIVCVCLQSGIKPDSSGHVCVSQRKVSVNVPLMELD